MQTLLTTSYTIFVVARLTNATTSGTYSLISLTDLNVGQIMVGANGTAISAFFKQRNSTLLLAFSKALTISQNQWHIFNYTIIRPPVSGTTGVRYEQRLDGKPDAEASSGNNLSAPQEMMIAGMGEQADQAATNCWNGDIAETIVYNRYMLTPETAKIESYLSEKYTIPLQK